jgi:uncharacterized membrane protein
LECVGLTVSLASYDNFEELLVGANQMDDHFRTTDFENNMPVVLAYLVFGIIISLEPVAYTNTNTTKISAIPAARYNGGNGKV